MRATALLLRKSAIFQGSCSKASLISVIRVHLGSLCSPVFVEELTLLQAVPLALTDAAILGATVRTRISRNSDGNCMFLCITCDQVEIAPLFRTLALIVRLFDCRHPSGQTAGLKSRYSTATVPPGDHSDDYCEIRGSCVLLQTAIFESQVLCISDPQVSTPLMG